MSLFRLIIGILSIICGLLMLLSSSVTYEPIDGIKVKDIDEWNSRHKMCFRTNGICMIGLAIYFIIHEQSLYGQLMELLFTFGTIASLLGIVYNNIDHFRTPFISSLIKRKEK